MEVAGSGWGLLAGSLLGVRFSVPKIVTSATTESRITLRTMHAEDEGRIDERIYRLDDFAPPKFLSDAVELS